jgi:hypothetical protein
MIRQTRQWLAILFLFVFLLTMSLLFSLLCFVCTVDCYVSLVREGEFMLQANAWGVDVFQDVFGISPRICVIVWIRFRLGEVFPGIGVKHFLWALDFLKVYSTQNILRAMMGKPAKQVFRNWVWVVVKAVADAFEDVVSILLCSLIDCCILSHFLFLSFFLLYYR